MNGASGADLAVFAGPSLPPSDRIVADRIAYLPPATRGDVERASHTYRHVLLIDGVFHHDLAPSPKEVYAAAQRCRLSGAASMGALRAAECAPYGMTPVGAIALWYLHGTIDGDDEVAVLVDPATQRALTVASVNVRFVARCAVRARLWSPARASDWIERSRAIFYMDRTWEDCLELLESGARAQIEPIVRRRGDLKRQDARFAVRRAQRVLESQ